MKKIKMMQKPMPKEVTDSLDKWVNGEKSNFKKEVPISDSEDSSKDSWKRIGLYVPDSFHKKIKFKALESNQTMNDLIFNILRKNLD